MVDSDLYRVFSKLGIFVLILSKRAFKEKTIGYTSRWSIECLVIRPAMIK